MAAGWLRVTVRSPSDELLGALAEGLVACGGTAVEERADQLVTYLPADRDPATAAAWLREQLHAVLGTEPAQLEVEHVPEQDWLATWREGLQPRRVGERIVVSPTWSGVDAAPHEIVIRIDPQMAFGTGEHASTRGVLRLMQQVGVRPGDRLLDVGTGSGILAIAAAKLGAADVLAAESDADALPNAAENLERNGAGDRVRLVHRHVDAAFLDDAGSWHGILANVLSGVLVPLLPAFSRALLPGGWAILSGILREEAPRMRTAAAGTGLVLEAEDVEEEWWSVLLRRHD